MKIRKKHTKEENTRGTNREDVRVENVEDEGALIVQEVALVPVACITQHQTTIKQQQYESKSKS